jgi:hypothetical protein
MSPQNILEPDTASADFTCRGAAWAAGCTDGLGRARRFSAAASSSASAGSASRCSPRRLPHPIPIPDPAAASARARVSLRVARALGPGENGRPRGTRAQVDYEGGDGRVPWTPEIAARLWAGECQRGVDPECAGGIRI